MSRIRFAALAFAFVLATAACSGSSSTSPSTPSPAASSAAGSGSTVSIVNFSFQPATITISAGTTVTWTNKDNVGHTVTADDGSFKSDRLGSGTTFSEAFATAGTFTYHCSIHTSMTGTVIVH